MFPPHRNKQRSRQTAISTELTQQVRQMHRDSHVVRLGIEAIVQTQQQAAELYTKTLAEGEQIVEEAVRPLTPYQREALNHYQMAYLYEMLAIVEATDEEIIAISRRFLDHGGRHGND